MDYHQNCRTHINYTQLYENTYMHVLFYSKYACYYFHKKYAKLNQSRYGKVDFLK